MHPRMDGRQRFGACDRPVNWHRALRHVIGSANFLMIAAAWPRRLAAPLGRRRRCVRRLTLPS